MDSRQPTVAAVFSGQVRTFMAPTVRASIRDELLHGLCPSVKDCALELFLCAELGHCRSMQGTELGNSGSRSPTVPLHAFKSAWKEALGNLPVGHINWPAENCTKDLDTFTCTAVHRRWCTGRRRATCEAGGVADPNLLRWNASHHSANRVHRIRELQSLSAQGAPFTPPVPLLGMKRWLDCLPHVRARESARGYEFDWVLVARLDVGYFRPLPHLREFGRRGVYVPANHYSPLCDLFGLVAREYADAYLSSMSQLCCLDCLFTSPLLPWQRRAMERGEPGNVLSLDAEALLAAQLYVHAVPVYGGFVPFALVRPHRPYFAARARARAGDSGGMYSAECGRHALCDTASSALWDFAALGADAGGIGWPPCPADRKQACEARCWSARCKRTAYTLCEPQETAKKPCKFTRKWRLEPEPTTPRSRKKT